MKKILLIALVTVIQAETGYLTEEETTGTITVCYYEVNDGIRTINIPFSQFCPFTYEF